MGHESTKIHMFHFIIDEVMKNELLKLKVGEKRKNLSGVIVRILTDILFLLDKEHFSGVQRGSRYKCRLPVKYIHNYRFIITRKSNIINPNSRAKISFYKNHTPPHEACGV